MPPTNPRKGWEGYYRANQDRPASPLLRRILGPDLLPQGNRQAIDLGCGAGLETASLLNARWNVLAIDREPRAIERVEALAAGQSGRLVTVTSCFEELEELPSSALIHAGLSLPFCAPAGFPRLWALIAAALEPGGIFVGHLFGDRHDWASYPEMSFHTREEVEALCSEFVIELLRESEGDGGLVPHHWHRFDIILRKS
ncbi:methyltransferase domain-containing protein [Halopseudomonas sp. SMJS2]|uniref:class I SAM-dependent methyltransferase n=1 Tax=Halopseudomonas sp. SMJS2 TaxID=3041098 RepID=UPI002452AA2A|nr:class I SAM-dependent methyltransferase [Halopseudomonas sp. SMJS2]WGK62286.1 methyltransferase domain-containing protein [Halopseudomonas sp. SMJS2]